MQIIITLKDTTYKALTTLNTISEHLQAEVVSAIKNGNKIPEGLEPLIAKLIDDAKEIENG